MAKKLDDRQIMDVTELPEATKKLLISVGIATIGELRTAGQEKLTKLLKGKPGVMDSGIIANDIFSIFGRK